jgi:hypothetical protein
MLPVLLSNRHTAALRRPSRLRVVIDRAWALQQPLSPASQAESGVPMCRIRITVCYLILQSKMGGSA